MLTKLLTIKHWQLFLLIFICPLVVHWCCIIYVEYTPTTATNESIIISILATLVFYFISLTAISMWIWAIGLRIHDKAPHDLQLNQNRLTMACGFVFVALLFLILYIIVAISFIDYPDPVRTEINIPNTPNTLKFVMSGIIFTIMKCVVSGMIGAIGYICYHLAKTIKLAEMKSEIKLHNYIADIILVCLFPVGIWFIQPRLNRLIDSD